MMRARGGDVFFWSVVVPMARGNVNGIWRGSCFGAVARFEGAERRALDVGQHQREDEKNDGAASRYHGSFSHIIASRAAFWI